MAGCLSPNLDGYLSPGHCWSTDFAISVPTFLIRLHVPTLLAWAVAVAMLAASAPLLLRVSRAEAASIAPLIGLATSPHAWGYEAILALPALWLAVSRPTPVKVLLVSIAYVTTPFYLIAREIHFNVLAIPVLGGLALWIVVKLRTFSKQRVRYRIDLAHTAI